RIAGDRGGGKLSTVNSHFEMNQTGAAHLIALLDCNLVHAGGKAATRRQQSRKCGRRRTRSRILVETQERREHSCTKSMAASGTVLGSEQINHARPACAKSILPAGNVGTHTRQGGKPVDRN